MQQGRYACIWYAQFKIDPLKWVTGCRWYAWCNVVKLGLWLKLQQNINFMRLEYSKIELCHIYEIKVLKSEIQKYYCDLLDSLSPGIFYLQKVDV